MISVIITSFNQEEALRCSLPVFLSQTYCDYEVIVVDKNSEDLTVSYLEEMELSHKRLSHIVLPTSTKANNKDVMAMLLGIRHCVSQRVIIASAACVPHSEHWLDDVLAVWGEATKLLVIPELPGKYRGTDTFRLSLRQRYAMWLIAHGWPRRALSPVLGIERGVFLSCRRLNNKTKSVMRTSDLLVRYCSTKTNTSVLQDAKYSIYSLVP